MTMHGLSISLMKKQKSPMAKKPPAATPVSTGFWLLKSEIHAYLIDLYRFNSYLVMPLGKSSHTCHTPEVTLGEQS